MPIKYQNASYIYLKKSQNAVEAVRDVSFSIKENSWTAIVGKTGSGKSTLIQLLNGLLIPTSGSVFIDDFVVSSNRKLRTKKLQKLRKKVGIVFQFPEYQLFEDTVEKDVAFGIKNFKIKCENPKELVHNALSLVGLDESFYERSPFELSGGEKRKVSIASILVLNPDILVLDEPTAGLDPKSAEEVMKIFENIHNSGKTIIMVTHDMEIAWKYCDDMIVMDEGKVVSQTSPKEYFLNYEGNDSLEIPKVLKLAKTLKEGGIAIDFDNVNDIDSLVKSIKAGMKNE